MMIFVYLIVLLFFLCLNFSNKKSFFQYGLFSKNGYRLLKKKILSYGYNYDIQTHLFSNLVFLLVLAFLCREFEVRFESFVLFALSAGFLFPHIVIWILFHSYQERVFSNFTMFLQTFLAVFKINPKTYPTLEECEKVCEGEVLEIISDMKEQLAIEGSLENAMQILIHYQPHFIVHNLVSMVLTIENHGGFYSEGLDLIQDDIDDWIEDIYTFKKKQTSIRNKMMGLCLMSVVIAFMAKNMLKEIPFDTTSDLYQLAVFFYLASLFFTLFMAHRVYAKSWFEKEEQL